MTRIVVHIEKLVLTGMDRRATDQLKAAIQSEVRAALSATASTQTLLQAGDRPAIASRLDQRAHGRSRLNQAIGRGVANSIVGKERG